jgi:hypothetical protein
LLERLVVVDPAGRSLEHAAMLEDEQLAPARDVRHDAPAHERVDELAAQPPDLGVGTHGNPAAVNRPVLADVLPGRRQPRRGLQLDIVADRILADPDHADELGLDPGFLHHLPDRCLRDRLALLDPAAGDDRAELGVAREVEDEQLVEAGDRVLAGDVRGDGRARSQDCWARILALYARFFSW